MFPLALCINYGRCLFEVAILMLASSIPHFKKLPYISCYIFITFSAIFLRKQAREMAHFHRLLVQRSSVIHSNSQPCRAQRAFKRASSQSCREHREHRWQNAVDLGWLVLYLPLWKIWVCQLGWWFPIYGKIKFMFQITNQWELDMAFLWYTNHRTRVVASQILQLADFSN